MKKRNILFVSIIALFAVVVSACSGAASAQGQAAQSAAPGVNTTLSNTHVSQPAAGPGNPGRGGAGLNAAAGTLGVTVEELQVALQGAIPADCAANNQTQAGNREGCRPDLKVAAETLGVSVEELQAALFSGREGGRGERELTSAAETLGVSVEELQQAIDAAKPVECANQTQPVQGVDCRPDFEAVATTLGVTVEELKAALGHRGPDLAAAAETLGVSEEELQAAIETSKPAECANTEAGQPKDPNCRPDLESAAETLGVTVEQLQQALGRPESGHGGPGSQQPPPSGPAPAQP